MFRRNYFTFFLAAALFLTSVIAVSAQTAPVGGQVVLKKADGTSQPVAGAVVEVFRTDIKGKSSPSKTDKKGNFSFVGLLYEGTYTLSVSAPGIKPEIFPNVKAGAGNLVINVFEGDGKKLTEEEARQAVVSASSATPGAELTAEQKKMMADNQKQVAAVTERNEKAKNANAITKKALEEGDKAFKAANYDLAIAKFDEGIAADPEFEGSAPVLLNYKAVALKDRGFGAYKQAVNTDAPTKASALEKARKDFSAAISSFDKALTILKNAPSTDAALQKNYEATRNRILANYVEVYRLMIQTRADTSKTKEAIPIYEQYLAIEGDAAAKLKAQITLGDILREAGNSEESISAYRKGLEMAPDNADALAGLGLSLFNSGVIADNKAQKQEGLNYMQRFTEVAADNHPLKASVRDAVEYLKTQDKLAPQKTTKATKRKQ